jgi:hypothetical protein
MSEIMRTAIALRAFTERPDRDPLATRPKSRSKDASLWSLTFDCETTVDAAQALTVGFYQVRKAGELIEEGLFFDGNGVTADDQATLRDYSRANSIRIVSVATFRSDIFLKYAYHRHATVIGFNLSFDLSRIAINHGPARRHMRGGFSFEMSDNSDDPRVRVKHLSPRSALIDFAKPGKQDTPRGMRKRRLRVPTYRGHFVDVKTLASALLSSRFTLGSLAKTLGTLSQKQQVDAHGTITKAYLDYARGDVQVTWECFTALSQRYADHDLSQPIDRLLSEASIGKAYLQQMGIKPLLECDPEFSRRSFGEIFCAYYGGRVEVRNRRVIREVLYCDFKSMYPTVNSLMGLWDFVIAESVTVHDTTVDTRTFLESVTLEDLQDPKTWKKLCTIVRISPDGDVLPVRAKYNGETHTIGLNRLTSEHPIWYTLADCVVSKFLSGRCPHIVQAVSYRPGRPQEGLAPIKIMGREDYVIDPRKDDLFRRLIDLRDEAKDKGDSIEKTLKIIANSTSYGIFIEVIRDDAPKSQSLNVYGPDGDCARIMTGAVEEPGRYFHPLLGVLITGAARLMLGIAETLTLNLGLDWAFCDTDSLAIVRPSGVSREAFHANVHEIVNWFKVLNPYKKKDSILKFEGVNFGINSNRECPLYCFAISSKRYALFNLGNNNEPILRKASAHGLGHLMDPYNEYQAPPDSAAPQISLAEIGVKLWHHDLWIRIVEAAIAGTPNRVNYDWHSALSRPAALRYSASSPELLAWLDKWNSRNDYSRQVRPFGFLLSYTARAGVFAPPEAPQIVDTVTRGRPRARGAIAPVAPYNSDPIQAVSGVFDRISGSAVPHERLKTYAEVLAQYHLSPEDKFSGGRFLDRGRTERRQIVATEYIWIGKEANKVGECGEADPTASPNAHFGSQGRFG